MSNWILKEYPEMNHKLWVELIVEIRNNETDEVREFEDECLFCEERNEPMTYMWEEGNYSCDCNRRLFFLGVEDEDEEEFEENGNGQHCSDGLFSVNLKNKKDGKVFYREFTVLT